MNFINQHRLLYVISALVAAVSLGAAASLAWGALALYRRSRIAPTPPLNSFEFQISLRDFAALVTYLIWAEEKCHRLVRMEAGRREPRADVIAKWETEANAICELRIRINRAADFTG